MRSVEMGRVVNMTMSVAHILLIGLSHLSRLNGLFLETNKMSLITQWLRMSSCFLRMEASFLYNEFGEQVGSVLDGVTSRADVAYETDASNVVWRVTTERTFGATTNACTVVRERLTGLSDECRACTETHDLSGLWTRTTVSYDAETGRTTETVESSDAGAATTVKTFGVAAAGRVAVEQSRGRVWTRREQEWRP